MERIKGLRQEVLSLTRTLYKTLGELTAELETPEPAPVDRDERLAAMLEMPHDPNETDWEGCGAVVTKRAWHVYYQGKPAKFEVPLMGPSAVDWLLDRLTETGHGYRGNYQPDNQHHYFEVWGPARKYSGEALNPDRREAVLEAAYAAADDYWEKVGK